MATQADKTALAGRRWRRSPLTVPVRVTIDKTRHVIVVNARGSQINDGGLTVRADRELTIGDEAEIKFTPPHFYPFVRLRGVIRNRAGDLYGVEFLATSPTDTRQLGLFRHILLRWGT